MRTSAAIGLGAATVAVLDVAIAVEAARTGRAALFVVAVVATTMSISIVVLARRPTVGLRTDLADWVARTSAVTGEPEQRLLDRAVARHRAALDGGEVGDPDD
jgi:hypothetical protein